MFRLLLGAVLLVAMAAPGAQTALAQAKPPTVLSGVPDVPKTLPIIGGNPFGTADNSVASASASDKPDDVTYLIAVGNSPDEVDQQGRTGLMYAAISNYSNIAQTLISHAAKLDLRDKLGYTALHWAAEHGSIEIMRLLLAAKAMVDPQNSQGITPLMLAAANGNIPAVRLLLQNHADPSKQDYTGRDAIGWAAGHSAIAALLKNVPAK